MCEDFIYASFEEVEIKQLLLGRQIDWNSGLFHVGGFGGGKTFYVSISTKGSGTPTMKPKTGSPV